MLGLLSQRLFPLLQLTRMALVFTAISNSLCAWLLWKQQITAPGQSILTHASIGEVIALVAVSTGLYGFGMSLNDIIDRRRDRELAAYRPLPSGRIGVLTAHVICTALGLAGVAGGAAYAYVNWTSLGWIPLAMVIWTGLLITFYDFAGKYLVGLGLLALGLIRFFHAVIPAPMVPVLGHPLLLLNHVAILSLIAYRWEQKRPALTPTHTGMVLGGLAGFNALFILAVVLRSSWRGIPILEGLGLTRAILAPLAAAAVFALFAAYLRRQYHATRQGGQMLMLYGLLWLIVYDVTFLAAYVNLVTAGVMLALLPMAYGSVQVMRWWGRVMALSQRPEFRRAGE